MSILLFRLVLATTVFLEQEIPGIRFGPPDPLTGFSQPNYRQIDLDRDGKLDLLTPAGVLFQRDGLFPAGSAAPLPEGTSGAMIDAFGDCVYLRDVHGIQIVRWVNGVWKVALNQEAAWPDIDPAPPEPALEARAENSAPAGFSRYLTDIDVDGIPEIVVYAREGVNVYKRGSGAYSEHTVFDPYPPVTAAPAGASSIWPPESRELSIPGRHLDLKAFWRGERLTVVSREELPGGLARHRSSSYDFGGEIEGESNGINEQVYSPMPAAMQPIYLNRDESLDFAGFATGVSTATAFAEPIYDSFASTDGGLTVQRIRSKSYSPRCSLVDVDGDGDFDIATHRTEIAAGGLRESLNRFFFQRKVGHQVSFSVQNDLGDFVPAPRMTVDLSIDLGKVPYREGSMFRRYRSGDLIDVTGDFNGDGYKDLVVQQSENSLAIYLSRAYRFSKHPIYMLAIGHSDRFYVADIDANGLSDIALIRPSADQSGDYSRVYLARETSPL